MRKKQIIKRIMVTALSTVMVLGTVNTAWAGNVYGDDGSHIKIMTSAGESTSLPKTNFNGMQVSLLPADTEIWISSEGATANASTIFFYHGICAKDTLTDLDRITDTRLYGDSATNPLNTRRLQYDKQFSAFPVCDHPEPHDPRNSVYVIPVSYTHLLPQGRSRHHTHNGHKGIPCLKAAAGHGHQAFDAPGYPHKHHAQPHCAGNGVLKAFWKASLQQHPNQTSGQNGPYIYDCP